MPSLFDIGLSGLRASKYAMYLTGNNIANANNPFYTRREIDFVEISSSLFGGGVRVGDIHRIADTFANNLLVRSTQDFSKSEIFYERMKNLETFVDNDDSSVMKFINESLSALEIVNATPGSSSGRNFYLTQLGAMSSRMQQIDRQLKTEAIESKSEVAATVQNANAILGKLAYINQQMAVVSGSSGQPSMALLDQQDELLSSLSELIDFSHEVDDVGRVSVQMTNGLPLLLGDKVNPLVIMNTGSVGDINVGVLAGGTVANVNDLFTSGKIRGLMDYYDQTIGHAQHQLDVLALNVADKINRQNQLGVDTKGGLGGLVFKDINSQSLMTGRALANQTNTGGGNLTVSLNDMNAITAEEYTLNFDTATDFSLLRKSDGMVVQTGSLGGLPQAISVAGFSININSGTFNAGDNYNISPTRGAAHGIALAMSDGSGLALGLPVVANAAMNNLGAGTIELTAVLDTTNMAFSIPNQLNPPVRVEFITPTTYQLVNANDNSVLENNLTYDPVSGGEAFPTAGGYDPGYRIHLAGNVQAGDSFSIDYNNDGLGDNRNGLLLADLYRNDRTGDTFSESYQTLLLDVATVTSQAKISLDSTTILKNQAQNRRDEMSAVSLEEETMNIARYQESYMASAQVLEALKQVMDAIFMMMRS